MNSHNEQNNGSNPFGNNSNIDSQNNNNNNNYSMDSSSKINPNESVLDKSNPQSPIPIAPNPKINNIIINN